MSINSSEEPTASRHASRGEDPKQEASEDNGNINEVIEHCNTQIGTETFSLPVSCENEFGIGSDLDKIPTREGLTTSLFPSPLTCPSLEDMAYMDEDNQNIKSNENEPDYEEIESDYAEILDDDEKSKCKEDRSKVLRESSPILPLQGLHNLHTYEECGTEIIKKGDTNSCHSSTITSNKSLGGKRESLTDNVMHIAHHTSNTRDDLHLQQLDQGASIGLKEKDRCNYRILDEFRYSSDENEYESACQSNEADYPHINLPKNEASVKSTSQMQRSNPTESNNDSSQKHFFPRAPRENIRRDLLKSTINKKAAHGTDIETDYGDTLLSSDENSDCCSEPTSELEDVRYVREPGKPNDRKRVKTVNTGGSHSSDKSNNLEDVSRSLEPKDLVESSRNRSGSLRNEYETSSESKKLRRKIRRRQVYLTDSLNKTGLPASVILSAPHLQREASIRKGVFRTGSSKFQSNSSSTSNSVSSMISLPGVPPVPGVHDAAPLKEAISAQEQQRTVQQQQQTLSQQAQPNQPVHKASKMLDSQRHKELSGMTPGRSREDKIILLNIKGKEKDNSKHAQRQKVEKKRMQDDFNIATGLFRSKAVFAIGAIGGRSTPEGASETSPNETGRSDDDHALTAIPHGQSANGPNSEKNVFADKPMQKRILRKVLTARLNYTAETKEIAETRFSESEFVVQCLEWHNNYREIHSAPPLQFDAILCATAQHWANMLAHKDEFYYQNPPNLGENLFAWSMPGGGLSGVRYSGLPADDYSPFGGRKSSSSVRGNKDNANALSGKNVADYWYKTRQYYDYTKHPSVLHAHAAQFTQMVWSNSVKFGCGKARSRTGKIIVVANYEPKGNIPGIFHENVFPPNEADKLEKQRNSFVSESDQDCIREYSIQTSSLDDEVTKTQRKKSSISASKITSFSKESQGDDENELDFAKAKYKKSRLSSLAKGRNNIRVMLSKFVRTNNNNVRRHERAT